MDNASGGQIIWDLNLEAGKFDAGLAGASAKAKAFGAQVDTLSRSTISNLGSSLSGVGDSIVGLGSQISHAGTSLSNFGRNVTRLVAPAAIALGGGLGLVSFMAFRQVDAVQQATTALNAYEKNGKKVQSVLSGLLSYARSDLGVLFNRKDLFAAAQSLKVMGDNTDHLVEHVKIMSRSVGLGLSTWEDLNRIVGRVGSTGRLAGDDFDNLTKAGYKLNPALRNTNITFDSLFKALDKGIPVDAMKGQANTIRGIGVRMQTAFRGIGEDILGVNKDTGQFVKGGAGDQLVKFFGNLPKILKQPGIQQGFNNLGKSLAGFTKDALPKLVSFVGFLGRNIGTISKVTFGLLAFGLSMSILGRAIRLVSPLITGFGLAVKGLGTVISLISGEMTLIGTGAAALISPISLVVLGVLTAVAAIAFLQIKFGLITKAIQFLHPVISILKDTFSNFGKQVGLLVSNLMTTLAPAIDFVKNHATAFKDVLLVLIGVALLPILIPIAAFVAAIKVVTFVLSVVNSHFGIVKNVILALFGPIVLALGHLGALKNAFSSMASGAVSAIGKVFSFVVSLPGKIKSIIGNTSKILYNAGKDVIQGFLNGMGSLIKSIGSFFLNKLPGWIRGPFKKALGISSPSKVFAGYGKNIVQGLIQGLGDSQGMIDSAVSGMVGSISAPVTIQGGASAIGNKGVVIQQTNQIYNQVDLDRVTRDLAWRVNK